MKWGWDHQSAREVKGKVRFLCLKTHSGIVRVKGEQVKYNSWLFPSSCDWTFSSTPRHPRDTSLLVSRKKSCASLTIYVIYVFFTCPYQVYVEIMAVLTHLQRNEELPAPSSGKLSTLFFFLKRNLAALLLLVVQNSSELHRHHHQQRILKTFPRLCCFCFRLFVGFDYFFWVGGGRSAIQTF